MSQLLHLYLPGRWEEICVDNKDLSAIIFSQKLQVNVFSPIFPTVWRQSLDLSPNPLLQTTHRYRFWSLCLCIWRSKDDFLINLRMHISHSNGFSLVWIFKWIIFSSAEPNSFWHNLQVSQIPEYVNECDHSKRFSGHYFFT